MTNGNPRGTSRGGEGAEREDVKGSDIDVADANEKTLESLPNKEDAHRTEARTTPSPPRGEGWDGVVDHHEPDPKLPQ